MTFAERYATWPTYETADGECRVARVVEVIRRDGPPAIVVQPNDDGMLYPFDPSAVTVAPTVAPGWYAVVYADGWRALLPPDAFEREYRRRVA